MRKLAPLFSLLVTGIVGSLALEGCGSSAATPVDGGTSGTDPDATLPDGALPDGALPDASAVFTAQACDVRLLVSNLDVPASADYVELRRKVPLREGNPIPDAGASATEVLATDGSLCAKAVDKAACQAAYDAIVTPFVTGCVGDGGGCAPVTYVIVNRGDDVKALRTTGEVSSYLGDTSTPTEATLLATVAGFSPLCSAASPRRLGDGAYEVLTIETSPCGPITKRGFVLRVEKAGGSVAVLSTVALEYGGVACGRRPAGLSEVASFEGETDAGRFFARCAHLEHASVTAFRALASELRALGAPEPLIAMAEQSARDEIRHTRMTARLARRFGAEAVPSEVVPAASRTLFDIALENMREGCVGESYGALLAEWQSRHASDSEVRAVMRAIARDEARHAELAWATHDFLVISLTSEQRAELEAARTEAVASLRRAAKEEPADDLIRIAGLPSAGNAARLLDAIDSALWSVAA